MIYFLNNKVSVSKNKSDLINLWMKKITESFLKSREPIVSSLLLTEIDYKFLEKVRADLIKNHKYSSTKPFNWRQIKDLYRAFYAKWDNLVMDSRLKDVLPTTNDYESVILC